MGRLHYFMPKTAHHKTLSIILIVGILALLTAVGLVVARVFSVEDTWIQDRATGAWVRHGNPQGAAHSTAVADCWARQAGKTYDIALAECLSALCALDQVCINDLMDRFETLRINAKEEASQDDIPTVSPSQPSAPQDGSAQTQPPPTEPISPVSATSFLRVDAPAVNAELASPFKITGEVQQDVKSLTVNIKGANNETLITETVTPRAEAVEGWRPFKLTLSYEFSRTKAGTVEVTPDGESDKAVIIPVIFN